MGQHAKDSPFIDTEIRPLAGSAVFAEAAICAGNVWDPGALEELIHMRSSSSTRTNIFRKMYSRSVPEESTCKLIDRSLTQVSNPQIQCNTLSWRNHPIWPLLQSREPDKVSIDTALRSVKSDINNYIWLDPECTESSVTSQRYPIDIDLIQRISKEKNLESLITLTACAREARSNKNLLASSQCAHYLKDVFPRAICSTPHLYIRWPSLLEIYRQRIWTVPESTSSTPWIPIDFESLITEIECESRIALEKGVPLPPTKTLKAMYDAKPRIRLNAAA